jgi:hypothetical protein
MLIQYMAEKREGGLNAATDEDVADLQVGAVPTVPLDPQHHRAAQQQRSPDSAAVLQLGANEHAVRLLLRSMAPLACCWQCSMLGQRAAARCWQSLYSRACTALVVLQVLYRAAKARFDEEEDFKTRSREAVTELQGGKPEYLKVLLLKMLFAPLFPLPSAPMQPLIHCRRLPCPALPCHPLPLSETHTPKGSLPSLPICLSFSRPGSASATPRAASSKRSTTGWT